MKVVFWAGFWSFLIDQASKYFVVHWLDLRQRGEIDVLPPVLNFRMAWNEGVNFGLMSGSSDIRKWALIGIAVLVSGLVLYWVHKDQPGKYGFLSAGLLVGGALGNIVDRLLYGAVADFLNMSCCGFENPYAFNVADVSIFVGALGLVFFAGGKKAT